MMLRWFEPNAKAFQLFRLLFNQDSLLLLVTLASCLLSALLQPPSHRLLSAPLLSRLSAPVLLVFQSAAAPANNSLLNKILLFVQSSINYRLSIVLSLFVGCLRLLPSRSSYLFDYNNTNEVRGKQPLVASFLEDLINIIFRSPAFHLIVVRIIYQPIIKANLCQLKIYRRQYEILCIVNADTFVLYWLYFAHNGERTKLYQQ